MTQENTLIIAVKKNKQMEAQFQSSLEELISLSKTAGAYVEKVVTQNLNNVHPATYIGEGKIKEVKHEIETHDIDLVIANNELSPGQLRNLGNQLNVRLIDRSQLILDIFASRAKTKEGKLQVELAQLEYLLPRLQGQGESMSRLGGGIGTRGPGETKLETDRRYINSRIHDVKRRLKLVVRQRAQYRNRRKSNDVFQIAIVGYTNAGKSTIFNRLTNSDSLEEDKLFATLDPLTRKLKLPSGFESLITDTVGFLQDLPTPLIASFRSTLEEVAEADFLLHVVDGSQKEQEQQTVFELLEELEASSIPMLTVYNKKDLMGDDFIPANSPYIMINAFNQQDLDKLLHKIEAVLTMDWEPYAVRLEADQGKQLNQLQQKTIVTDKSFDEDKNKYILKGYIEKEHPLNHIIREQQER